MAKSLHPYHSDQVKGSVGALTHRTCKGIGTVSRLRQKSPAVNRRAFISTPQEIAGLWSWFVADRGLTLRVDGLNKYVKFWNDQIGGFGQLAQSVAGNQPKWIVADPAHNNRPYVLPDATDDSLSTTPLVVAFAPPLDVWIVATDAGTPSTARTLLSLNSTVIRHLNVSTNPLWQWRWQDPAANLIAQYSDATVKIWRLSLTPLSAELFWNGVSQNAPAVVAIGSFNRLRLFATHLLAAFYNKPLFEILFWRRILNSTESALLLRYLNNTYDVFAE